MKLLISFCNTELISTLSKKKISPLACLDTSSNTLYWVRLPIWADSNGVTGLTADKKCVYVAYQRPLSKGTVIVVLDKSTLKVRSEYELTAVEDVHSLAIRDSFLYLVSTGTDTVYKISLKNGLLDTASLQRVWSPKYSKGTTDTHHINGICNGSEGLIISAFGKKSGRDKSTATQGYVYNLSKQEFAVNNISHPHSIIESNGELVYAESASQTIYSSKRGSLKFTVGYIRGLCMTENDYLVIGRSSGRRVSRSSGRVNNIMDKGRLLQSCSITIFKLMDDKKFNDLYSFLSNLQKEQFFNYRFNDYFREIYDVISLDGKIHPTNWISKTTIDRDIDISLISLDTMLQKAKREDLLTLYKHVNYVFSLKANATYDLYEARRDVLQMEKELAFEKENVAKLKARLKRIEESKLYKVYTKLNDLI
ncbi:DUF4915 domain-containing protein [Candidatus Woesebacteria bacterium]|nr:DUF4915 domain-containing protein [Candidatus Woesebacteria bacterium]